MLPNIIARITILIIFLSFVAAGCTKEFPCTDNQIQTAFVGFPAAQIDTFVLRKFKANDNFQTLIDTILVTYGGSSGVYSTSNDTTSVSVNDGINGITAGFDWQVYVPARNKVVFVSDIKSEKKTGNCRKSIFSVDGPGCYCINKVFSANQDNQLVTFSNSPDAINTIYIQN